MELSLRDFLNKHRIATVLVVVLVLVAALGVTILSNRPLRTSAGGFFHSRPTSRGPFGFPRVRSLSDLAQNDALGSKR